MTTNNKAGDIRSVAAPAKRRSASDKQAGSPGFDKKLDGPNRPST